MTDSAVTSPDLTAPEPTGGGFPAWSTFARQHEWRRAQAAASLGHADPALQSAVSALSALQEDVRAKRYAAARRSCSAYAHHLTQLLPADAAILRSLASPERLEAALSALENAQNESAWAQMHQKLAPAFEHQLTRAEAHNALGVLHAILDENPQAQQQFTEALESDAGHYRARMNLGNLALEAGNPAAAEAHYREVLKLAPDYDGAHHNLGVALRKQGHLQASVSSIRRAQKLGMRRTQQDAKEEMREQLRANPQLRQIRAAVLMIAALLILLILFKGRGH